MLDTHKRARNRRKAWTGSERNTLASAPRMRVCAHERGNEIEEERPLAWPWCGSRDQLRAPLALDLPPPPNRDDRRAWVRAQCRCVGSGPQQPHPESVVVLGRGVGVELAHNVADFEQ